MQEKVRKGLSRIFHYQIENEPEGNPGDLAVIYNSSNRFLAIGLYDPASPVRLRVLQRGKPAEISVDFFINLLRLAEQKRRALRLSGTTGYRLINGEGDGFSGLVLDCYGESAVLKIYAECWLPHLKKLLLALHSVADFQRIVLRLSRELQSEISNRATGVPYFDGQMLYGERPSEPVHFKENGLSFTADLIHGQKTGFFLDQRENRERVRELSKGKSVLNVFSYTGAFSVYAKAGGAESVFEIDANGKALEASRRHWKINFSQDGGPGQNGLEQLEGDAFFHLEELRRKKKRWDIVILDPPAFARNKKQVETALKSYFRLAQSGARLLKKNGILISASCSKPVGKERFFNAIERALSKEGLNFKELWRNCHAMDHPAVCQDDEYLKAICFNVKKE